jgi:rubrerythrin
MDVYVCENCLALREVHADEPAPERCPSCDRPDTMVEAYVADRFARREVEETV